MPDRTPRGRTVEELSSQLKRRRAQLGLSALRLENERLDVDILAQEEQILRHQATIAANEERIRTLQAELDAPTEET